MVINWLELSKNKNFLIVISVNPVNLIELLFSRTDFLVELFFQNYFLIFFIKENNLSVLIVSCLDYKNFFHLRNMNVYIDNKFQIYSIDNLEITFIIIFNGDSMNFSIKMISFEIMSWNYYMNIIISFFYSIEGEIKKVL